MSDTPITSNPPSRADIVKAFIGDLARPVAIIATSIATSVAIIIISLRTTSGTDGSILIGAAGLIVGGMYGFKTLENNKTKSVDGDVAKAGAQS